MGVAFLPHGRRKPCTAKQKTWFGRDRLLTLNSRSLMYNLRIFRLEALCKAKAVFAYILILLDALPVALVRNKSLRDGIKHVFRVQI